MNFSSDLSNLDIETQRKIGAFVGAIVGDAASLHLEWIYDQNKVDILSSYNLRRQQNFAKSPPIICPKD